jgi:hypothetical protein
MLLREGKFLRLHLAELAVRLYRLLPKYSVEKDAATATLDRDAKIAVLTRELEDAHREQAATAEILKVISRSGFDLPTVLATLGESATKLCVADQAFIYRYDCEFLRVAADHGASPVFRAFRDEHPAQPGDGSIVGRAAVERRTVHVPDVLADAEYQRIEAQRLGGYRSLLSVPMLRNEVLLGVIQLWRTEPRPFADRQIELVTTFADQAVIAIENARLFNEVQARTRELRESLEHQTATSDVLNVIIRAPSQLQPVFDTIVETAARLCDAEYTLLYRLQDGNYHVAAANNVKAEFIKYAIEQPLPPGRGSLTGRTALENARFTCRIALPIRNTRCWSARGSANIARSSGCRCSVME